MFKKQLLEKIFFFLIILVLNFQISLYSEEIKAKEIWTIKGSCINVYLSPDGSYIAWSHYGHDRGPAEIYIAKVGTQKREKLGRTKELFGWLDNEYLITVEGFLSIKTKKTVSKIEGIKDRELDIAPILTPPNYRGERYEQVLCPFWIIQNGQIKKSLFIPSPYCFLSLLQDRKNKKIIVFANSGAIFKKGDVEAIFHFVVFPDGEKVFLKCFPGKNRQIVIDVKENKYYSLPAGSHFSLSPNGQKLIFTKLKDDGHFFTEGELFLCNWDGTNIRHIEFEKKRIRYNPSFGPPDMITYVFDDENHRPCIGVAKLFLQHKGK